MTLPWGHVDGRIASYCDGAMSTARSSRATAHLARCERCRAARDEYRFAAGMMKQLALTPAPDSIWESLEARHGVQVAATLRGRDVPVGATLQGRRVPVVATLQGRLGWAWPAVAVAVCVALVAAFVVLRRPPREQWAVTSITGSAAAGGLAVGETLETDGVSKLRLIVGSIGTVDVEPNTRVRLVSARSSEQRMALDRGTITATIDAAPRLFFVNTPNSTVVDLGCQYTMRMDEGGLGHLRVTQGFASFEFDGRESLVPAGASCVTRPGGPGTPSFDDSSAALREAVERLDVNREPAALDIVLREARVRDTLTLWHLLPRVAETDRARVFDRIVALTPLPAGVTRERALQLDKETLTRWREELAWTW